MKKWKLFMNFFCILIAIDCLMGILSSFSNNVQEITLSYKCESVGNANRILAHNGKIYIGDTVNDICPVRTMEFSRKCRTVKGYETRVKYDFRIVV